MGIRYEGKFKLITGLYNTSIVTTVAWNSPTEGDLGHYNGFTNFNFTPVVTVSGVSTGTVFSLESGTLPAGTSLDSATGDITGVLEDTAASYTFTIRVSDNGVYADRTFNMSVDEVTHVSWISPAAGALSTAAGGSSYSFASTIQVYFPVGSTVYSVSSGTLPAGTNLNAVTGAITGTLTNEASNYSFTIRATNNNTYADRSFTGSVTATTVVSWNSPTAGARGASAGNDTYIFAANTSVIHGVGNTTYSVITGTLPAGTNLEASTGIISGTLTNAASDYGFTIRATNNGSYADRAFTGSVTATTVVSWNGPTSGDQGSFDGGTSYSLTPDISVVNAVGSTTYSVSAGQVPAGTSLNPSTGEVTGTLTNAGSSYSFTIRATNHGVSADRAFAGTVTPVTVVTWNSPAAGALGTSLGNSSFNFTPSITVVNAVGSTVYSVSSGSLPAGTSLNSSTGKFTGTLDNADSDYSFTIRATNNGVSSDRAFTGSVAKVVVTWNSPMAGALGASAGGTTYSFVSNVAVTSGVGSAGSFELNGSQHLSVPGGLITGNFAMETWVYPTSGGSCTIFSDGAYMAGSSLMVFLNGGGVYVNSGSAGGNIVNGAGSTPLNTWSHIAWERIGTTNTIYVNGSAVTTFSYGGQFGASGFAIGSTTAGQYGFVGNMSGIRLVTSAVYNGNFSAPTAPPSAITNTVLLLKSTSAGTLLADASGLNTTVTNSGTTWSASSPFTPIVFSISSGAVPAGTSLDTATGIISGTLTNVDSTYLFTVRATVNGVTADRSFTGSVNLTMTYAVSPSVTSVNEGNAVTFTVTTYGVANATTLYWTNNGTTSAADFSDSNNSGSFTITSNSGTFTRTISADALTEGSETIIAQIRTVSVSGTVVATANTVTVNDTSITPTYAVSPSVSSVNEGNAVTFTVTTAGVSDGTTLYWTNNGTTSAADFSDSANSGSFTITSNSGTFTRTLLNDVTTEGSETIIAQIRTVSVSGTVVATANTVTVNDTSVAPAFTYAISPSVTSVNEGNTVSYTVTTSGVSDGTSLYWTNNGTTSPADFTEGGSISFNSGQSNYLQVTTDAMAGDFTVEAWVNLTGLATTQVILGIDPGWEIWVTTTGTLAYYASGYKIQTALAITANTWNHIALVRQGSTTKMYVNGVADVNTSAYTATLASQSSYIGRDNGAGGGLTGKITNLRIVNGTAVYTTNFTPSTTPLSAITNTSLLLNAKTSTSMSTDSSTNNKSVTVTGTPTFDNSNPFVGGSIYQNDMSAAYPVLPTGSQGSNFTFAGDFTIEAWVYYTSASGTDGSLYAASSDGSNYFAFNINMSANAYSVYLNGGATSIGSHGISANTWTHVALVRSGSTITAYTNGVSKGTVTNSSTLGYSTLSVHRMGTGASTRYVTNFRMVKSAVYTANFTPPTATLTAIANTVILLNASSSSTLLTDSSANNYTVTATGTPTWSPLNPVAAALTDGSFKVYSNSATITRTLRNDLSSGEGSESLILNVRTTSTSGTVVATANTVTVNDTSNINPAYSISPSVASVNEGNTVVYTVTTSNVADGTTAYWTNNGTTSPADFTEGGSIAFTGNGQYVSIPSNATFAFSGDFTVEAWIYIAPGSGLFSVFNVGGASTGSYSLYWNNATGKFDSVRYGSAGGTTTGTYATGQWMHVAAVRASGTAKLYINGVADAGATFAMPSISASTNVSIGLAWGGPSYNQLGYISNLRVVSGTALYTSNFTPSTTPLTAVTNTALLLNTKSSTAVLTDSSTNAFTLTNSGTSFDNTNPFAGGSVVFNGSSQYLTAPSTTAFNMGSGDFTVECWVNLSDATKVQAFITTSQGSDNQGFFLGITGSMWTLLASSTGSSWDVAIAAGTPVANVWTHVAAVRNGSTWTLYVNGTSVGTATASVTLTNTNNLIAIGGRTIGSPTQYTSGKITNVRVVKGTALYTANFTPSTTVLTAVANTSLLLNASSSSGMLTDSSTNNFTVTNVNTATWSPISPVVTSLTDGSFKVYSNSATITRTLRNDLATEGSESLILNVRTTSTSGTVVATANTVTVNDTSVPPTYYLAVAGGGGGGAGYAPGNNPGGSGGGAGGLLSGTLTFTAGATYTVTVGNGGAGGAASTGAEGGPGTNGANSSIIGTSVSLIALGGGGGGAYSAATIGAGKAGGSGGGGTGGGAAGTAGAGTAGPPRQGYDGGRGGGNFGGGGGGGGGSSAAGTAAAGNAGGAGGAGTASTITGNSVTYAGGGGGSGGGSGSAGAAGAAGGGAGNLSANGGNATVNTGSGGGGGGNGYAGGNGATGVVILSIPTASYTGTVTGSPTVTTSGSNTIVKFTANGTYIA